MTVTGFSPQVITETLCALCLCQGSPFVPTRILSENLAWFRALRRD